MKTTRALFWTDLCLFLVTLSLIVTGAALRWAVPGRCLGGSGCPTNYLGFDRAGWLETHFFLGVAFFLLTLLHLVQHWAWIQKRFEPRAGGRVSSAR